MEIRLARADDAVKLIELYSVCGDYELQAQDVEDWADNIEIFAEDDNYNIYVAEVDGEFAASVTLVIVPNLTHSMRPYAFIENVVTFPRFQGQYIGTELLNHATAEAERAGCYKLTITTGSKRPSTLRFYKNAGFTDGDKTAFTKRF
ncbi:MAG: GNAT family N-acetyltransferase [Lactobacillales bacterium]|jgi:GNAT superfamily N-acetyltransferase|nr:GNAT family N-acetyltransferase [Lactobacillales bacterium]